MVGSIVGSYADPELYQAAVRPAKVEVLPTAKGGFAAELVRLELPGLWLQSGRENLPRIVRASVSKERPPFFFLSGANQAAVHHSGTEVSPGEIIVVEPGSAHHVRSEGACEWSTLCMARDAFSAAASALLGRDLTLSSFTHRFRPSPPLMSRLTSLHRAAIRFAKQNPDILAPAQPARALEQSILHAMILCAAESAPVGAHFATRRHRDIVARFEDLLATNHDQPLYLTEVCAALGVAERTLRVCCNEHLGMGPLRYLLFRRMHMAHRALVQAPPGAVTVTRIAMEYGFWEFGRFAVAHRALFGESPSASLRRNQE